MEEEKTRRSARRVEKDDRDNRERCWTNNDVLVIVGVEMGVVLGNSGVLLVARKAAVPRGG